MKIINELAHGLKKIHLGLKHPDEYAKATLQEAGRIDGSLLHGGEDFIARAEWLALADKAVGSGS